MNDLLYLIYEFVLVYIQLYVFLYFHISYFSSSYFFCALYWHGLGRSRILLCRSDPPPLRAEGSDLSAQLAGAASGTAPFRTDLAVLEERVTTSQRTTKRYTEFLDCFSETFSQFFFQHFQHFSILLNSSLNCCYLNIALLKLPGILLTDCAIF